MGRELPRGTINCVESVRVGGELTVCLYSGERGSSKRNNLAEKMECERFSRRATSALFLDRQVDTHEEAFVRFTEAARSCTPSIIRCGSQQTKSCPSRSSRTKTSSYSHQDDRGHRQLSKERVMPRSFYSEDGRRQILFTSVEPNDPSPGSSAINHVIPSRCMPRTPVLLSFRGIQIFGTSAFQPNEALGAPGQRGLHSTLTNQPSRRA